MNAPDNNDQEERYSRVPTRLSYSGPLRDVFGNEMRNLATLMAEKIKDRTGVEDTTLFREKLLNLLAHTEYETYLDNTKQGEDKDRAIFRFSAPNSHYTTRKDYQPDIGKIVFCKDEKGDLAIPYLDRSVGLQALFIPVNITEGILQKMPGDLAKRMFDALVQKSETSAEQVNVAPATPGPAAALPDMEAKKAALLAEAEKRAQLRADEDWERTQEEQRLLRNRERRQQRAAKQKQPSAEKQAAQEIGERLSTKTTPKPESELVKLSKAVTNAAQTALFAAKTVTRTTANIERLHKKIEENPQKARDPRIAERLFSNIKKQPKALERAAEAAEHLTEAQEALAAYKIKHHLRDEPVHAGQEYETTSPHKPRFVAVPGLHAQRPH